MTIGGSAARTLAGSGDGDGDGDGGGVVAGRGRGEIGCVPGLVGGAGVVCAELYGAGVTRTVSVRTGGGPAGAVMVAGLVGPVLAAMGRVVSVCGGDSGTGVDKREDVFKGDQNSAAIVTTHKNRAVASASIRAVRFFRTQPDCAVDCDTSRTGWVCRPGAALRPCSRSALAFFRASRM